MLFRVCGFFLALLVLSSCSYRWGYGERSLPGGFKTVAIPVFKNSSDLVGIEGAFTNSLIRQFAKSRVARVVDKKGSDVYIEGSVDKVELVHGGSIDANNDENFTDENKIRLPKNTVLTTEYRVLTSAKIRVIRTLDRKILWSGTVQGEHVYPAPQVGLGVVNSVNPLYNHNARINAVEEMSKDMMAEAHDRMTENF